jgi:tRNA-Thr(GGU) m(6)t(6)A37 methyltransferase TsaA
MDNRPRSSGLFERLRRALPRRRRPFPELPDVTLRPIGVVRNKMRAPEDAHRDDSESRIIVRPELADALLGLDSWSHIWVLFYPHRIPQEVLGSKHQLHPRDDPANPLQGVLATRSQIRFNPVLMTPVRLLSVKGNVLRVRGLDAIDGTPVLDIKPYIPLYDAVPGAAMPEWVQRQAQPQ